MECFTFITHNNSFIFIVHICCIGDGMVHFIWTRGWGNNYRPLSVEFIVINFKKGNIISLHDFLVFQYTLSTCQQAFSVSHQIQFIYLPKYFLLEACAHDLRLPIDIPAQKKKRVSERVSPGVIHIIRSETVGETSHQKYSQRVSDRITCVTPGNTLFGTRFCTRGYLWVFMGPYGYYI